MGETKKIFRARAVHLRDCLSRHEIGVNSRLIQRSALRFGPYLNSRAVALYSPIENEVATEEIREHALKTGKKLFYPKLGAGTDARLVRLRTPGDVKPGRYGILEPAGDETLTKEDAAGLVIFVPGLSFDLHGNRIGRGQGCYDRLLAALGSAVRRIGLAFECQIVSEIPTENWDQRVHHIITERKVIECGDLPSAPGWPS